ncbi:13872_t:CDS:2 [Acaulospora colombiana]|uniref:13872_t:CDS:1 n=1 Tax=Acaulospora colombiana TaxID=27376 RepID=A0ACA9KW01_9GLOM|nr:13872_t:CDS:2 [Acaulospora colombiana]
MSTPIIEPLPSSNIIHISSGSHSCIARLVHSGLYSRQNIHKHVIRTYFDAHAAGNHHIVFVDSVVRYRLPLRLPSIPNFIPFFRASNCRLWSINNEISLRIITKLEFNEQNKVVRHEDVWSLKDLVESMPIIGWLYAEVARKAAGLMTNGIVMLIQELTKTWVE